jgi:radical SAM/Cys-rich protein
VTNPVVPASTLRRRAHPLASASEQRARLDALPLRRSFGAAVAEAGAGPLRAGPPRVLQMNLGKLCNQTCRHCHVDAGPDRREVMSPAVVDACLALLERSPSITTIDLTGGAPELHPAFRDIVRRARALGRQIMDRCNLTVLELPRHHDLAAFLAEHRVEVVASLPHFAGLATDAQRGQGVFATSIEALRRLNRLGYGREGSNLVLTLVSNPTGAFLPGAQASIERDFRRELHRRWGVVFNRLHTITNMPISRFLEFLDERGHLAAYMERLLGAFNAATLEGLMCRDTLSVGWDGALYDCDFNQMLELPLAASVLDLGPGDAGAALAGRAVRVGPHCFGCTAGQGSSCGGAVAGGAQAR